MAGSPGAGKTEVSKELERVASDAFKQSVMRIDPDEFRKLFPDYNGANSHLFQRAIVPIVERVLDKAIANKQDFIFDGTLSNFGVAKKNIKRSLDKGRYVDIYYVYQEPLLSWKFVQARELVEGRRIKPETFVDQFFSSKDCVNRLKVEFGDEIAVHVVVKDYNQSVGDLLSNVASIDAKVFGEYNPRELLLRVTS